MNFVTEIEQLFAILDNTPTTEISLKDFINKCKVFNESFFPINHSIFGQLNAISTEPRGTYFPEMYYKLKAEALKDCKQSLGQFLKKAKEEFERQMIDRQFEEIIENEESQFLEFKSTLCWDVNNSKVDKKTIGEIIMKSICAFSNSEGGVLLIGIRDDKTVLGLEDDYKTFDNGAGTRDHFELHLTTLLINNFSKTFAKDNLTIEFPTIDNKEICLIRIKKGTTPFTVKISDKAGQVKEKFFIRVQNSSRDIDNLIEFARYIKLRFPNWN